MNLTSDQLKHFGLEEDPFVPFTGPFIETAAYQIAREEVRRAALGKRPEVGAVVGPTGIGKTEAVGRALRELGEQNKKVRIAHAIPPSDGRFNAGYILTPLLRAAQAKNHRSIPENTHELQQRCYESEYEHGERVLLVVNEAHVLPPAFLHYLRGAWEWGYMGVKGPLFSTLFVAQACFTTLLGNIREVRRRVPKPVALPRLSEDESRRILRARLTEAGNPGLFTEGAVKTAVQAGLGIPLDLIRFAGLACAEAWQEGDDKVKQSHAERAVAGEGGPVSLKDAVRDSGFTRTSILDWAGKAGLKGLNRTSLSQLENGEYRSARKAELTSGVLSVIAAMKEAAARGELPDSAHQNFNPRRRPDVSPHPEAKAAGKVAAAS